MTTFNNSQVSTIVTSTNGGKTTGLLSIAYHTITNDPNTGVFIFSDDNTTPEFENNMGLTERQKDQIFHFNNSGIYPNSDIKHIIEIVLSANQNTISLFIDDPFNSLLINNKLTIINPNTKLVAQHANKIWLTEHCRYQTNKVELV